MRHPVRAYPDWVDKPGSCLGCYGGPAKKSEAHQQSARLASLVTILTQRWFCDDGDSRAAGAGGFWGYADGSPPRPTATGRPIKQGFNADYTEKKIKP
jgi:hypothetical protein